MKHEGTFFDKKTKKSLRKVRKDVFRRKEACAGCAKGEMEKEMPCARCARAFPGEIMLAQTAQGSSETKWRLRKLCKGVQNQNGVCADCARMFSGKRGLRNVRKGEMKRKGFAAKEIFRNFAEN